jgi:hypothetical protein
MQTADAGASSPTRMILPGALGGVLATIAMTGVMLGAQRAGFLGTAPPRKLVDEAVERTRPRPSPDDRTRTVLASIVHLAIGSVAGVAQAIAYRWLARGQGAAIPATAFGAAFGLLLWAVNYVGLAPALQVLPPPDRDRPTRPPVMVLAHLVFGVASGALSRLAARA